MNATDGSRRISAESRVPVAYAAAVGLLVVVARTFPGHLGHLEYPVVGISLVGALAYGVLRHRPKARTTWYLMGVGQLLWVLGAVAGARRTVLGTHADPGLADAAYLLGYVMFALALGHLVRDRSRSTRDTGSLLETATVAAGLGLLAWATLGSTVLDELHRAPGAALVGVAYPALDIVVIGGLVHFIFSPGPRSPAFHFLLRAVALLVLADVVTFALELASVNAAGFADLLRVASCATWGAAALHPSMARLAEPVTAANQRFTRTRLTALVVAALVAPALLAIHQLTGFTIDVWPLIVGSMAMFVLVVLRMNVAIHQIGSVNRSLEVLQDELNVQATRDPLTGLANRIQTMRLAAGALGRSRRHNSLVGLLFIDLDGFKQVNDTYGHRAGDEVLRQVARRMEQEVRDTDFVGRLGGDEFVVGIEDLVDEGAAAGLANRLIAAISREIRIDEEVAVHVGASIGIAIGRGASSDIETLVHEADLALYQAKEAGRGRVEVFNGRAREALRERTDLERALITAMTEDQLVLHYQPIVHLATGQAECYEALVRWERPNHGLVPPGDFLPVIENTDLICDLGAWVLHAATDQLEIWNLERGDYAMQVSINISGRHISQARILDDVSAVLHNGLVLPPQLVIEVTETAPLDDVVAASNLETLRAMGVMVSLDDFGTGYQSSARLSGLPIDSIKIDRQFVQSSTETDHALLELMIKAGDAFGVRVIVEGVERPEELALVRSLGCEYVQGFYLGRPVPAPELHSPGPGRVRAG
ncbi:MAG: putative bifunctional diguanylate cyclase/phosphodiesterase [Marmoricola sp.]